MNVDKAFVTKSILIVGGYGRAGKNIAELLTKYSNCHIKIAGRDINKATICAKEIQDKIPSANVEPGVVDLAQRETINTALEGIDLVVVASPLIYSTTQNIIDSMLLSSCSLYLDISPGIDKHRAFEEKQTEIEKSDKTFIVDAGCEPGMPAVLTKFLKTISPQIYTVYIQMIYRDNLMPESSVKDLLRHNEKPQVLKDGIWTKVKGLKTKKIAFPMGFGRQIAVPVWMPELANIHIDAHIENLEYYHAGINRVSNLVSLIWRLILRFILPLSAGVKLFQWSIRKYTKPPIGGVLIVGGKDENTTTEVHGFHKDIYVATAIPAAASSLLLLKDSTLKSGKYFMYEPLNIAEFISLCTEMGMEIKVHSK